MAADDTAQEKTEEPTDKRLREAREKGQVARSRELSTLLSLGMAGLVLWVTGPTMLSDISDVVRFNFTLHQPYHAEPVALLNNLYSSIGAALLALAPFFAAMTVVALAGPLALGGWAMSGTALAFQWSRIDPIKGMKRVVGPRGFIELAKAMIKVVLLGVLAGAWLWHMAPTVGNLGFHAMIPAIGHAGELVLLSFLIATAPMILVAAVDVPFQLWQHNRDLRMSRQQVKDDHKETEGNPEMRARVRRTQNEIAQRRMMSAVPEADVIVVNPTHYAVALRYQEGTMDAPVVVAMGVDFVAMRIIEVGRAHSVPTVRAPLLARALYFNGALNQRIPADLFMAVAQVLAWLYQLRRDDALPRRVLEMTDLPIPAGLRTE